MKLSVLEYVVTSSTPDTGRLLTLRWRFNFLGRLVGHVGTEDIGAWKSQSQEVLLNDVIYARRENGKNPVRCALKGQRARLREGVGQAASPDPRCCSIPGGRSALTYIPMALLPPIGVFITFAFLCGLSWGPIQPLLTTIVQLRVDPDAQGRVFGIQTATFYVAPPAAMFLAGVLAESFGVMPVLLGIAGLLVITSLAVLRVKSLRDLDSDRVG